MKHCLNNKGKLILSIFVFLFVVFLTAHFTPFTPNASAQLGPQQRSVSVSAVVPPTVADFQFDFSYFGPSLVHQDQVITYEITYGASSSAGLSTSNGITVHYSNDKAPDKSFLTEYVFGSATKGYGDVQPVVDTKNRTITWHLAPLPEGTMNQKVRFQLRATGQTHDLKRLTFSSRANMHNEYVSLPDYGVQQDYLFDPSLVTPGPTATPDPKSVPSPTPTISPLQFSNISIRSLTQSQATVLVTTNKPTRKTIRFGTLPTTLTQQVTSADTTMTHTLDLPNLTAATQYYYQVIATDTTGKSIRSDILTFTSAQASSNLQISRDAFMLTSGNTMLLSDILQESADATGFVILPSDTAYKLTYTFAIPPTSTLHEVIVSNEQGVLQRLQMTPVDTRTYIAHLRAPNQGTYTIEMIQTDDKGNITSRKLSSLKISPKFRVLDSGSSTPVHDARVTLLKYNTSTQKFELVDESIFTNPSFTDAQGETEMVLNNGRYRVTVTAFGYGQANTDFTIGTDEGNGYPTVYLKRDIFDFTAITNYLWLLFVDSFNTLEDALHSFSKSIRAFTSLAVTTLTSFVFIGFSLFSLRTDIRWKEFLPFFIFRLAFARGKHAEIYLFGVVMDKDGKLLGDVRIEFMHVKSGVILQHTTTNQSGGFRVANTFEEPYIKLVASKEGMPSLAMIVATDTKNAITVKMHDSKEARRESLFAGIKHIVGGFFEVALIISLLLELLFIEAFGVARTLPFIALTFFNLALWIFYEKERNLHRV